MQNNGEPAQDDGSASDETRPIRGGEAATTRFGMEDGDNSDVPSTGTDPDRQSPDKR